MSLDNPSYADSTDGTKKFAISDPINFSSGKAKRTQILLIVLVAILFVIALVFIILYANEKGADNDSTSETDRQGL